MTTENSTPNKSEVDRDDVQQPDTVKAGEDERAAAGDTDSAVDDLAKSEAAADEQVSVSRIQFESLQQEVGQARDQLLRAHAEMQNVKRRATQDVEKAHKFALDKFVNALIPVVDSLEKGIDSAKQVEGVPETMVEGMELTHKQFLDALGSFQVEQEDPAGQPFDPNFHQAMSQVENPKVEAGTVVDVFQKGYKLHGRLIRPAMVVVSK